MKSFKPVGSRPRGSRPPREYDDYLRNSKGEIVADLETGELLREPSMTDQSYRNEVNVNSIMKKYFKDRDASIFRGPGSFIDLTTVTDLQGAFARVAAAEDAFMQLPSEIRTSLDNDPRNLESYLANPKNFDDAVKYGLFEKPPEPPPVRSPDKPSGETPPVSE